jgi:hypothetical protein
VVCRFTNPAPVGNLFLALFIPFISCMNKRLIGLGVFSAVAAADQAQAQASLLVHGISAGIGLGRMAARKKEAVEVPTVAVEQYRGQSYPRLRTPDGQLPKKGEAEIREVEAQLDRFHSALRADSTSALCTPEQRTAFQAAIVSLARAQSKWDLQPYQQEATFYLAEDTRRQRASAPAK